MKISLKKKIAAAAAAATIIGGASAALAYFTANGAGDGTATVGSATGIILSATAPGNLYPAGPPRDVAILVTNPGDGSQHVGFVKLDGISTTAAGCDTTVGGSNPAFTMGDVQVGATLLAHASTTVHGSLQMNDTETTQNTCQGAALTLHLSSN